MIVVESWSLKNFWRCWRQSHARMTPRMISREYSCRLLILILMNLLILLLLRTLWNLRKIIMIILQSMRLKLYSRRWTPNMKEKRSPSKNSYSSIKKINFMNSTKTIDWIDNDIYLYLYIQNFIKKFKKILMLSKFPLV